MKFKKLTIFFFLLLSLQILHAIEIITLPEKVEKPKRLLAYEETFYIAERNTVHTFSLPALKYVRSFGRKGEGPGEFRGIDSIYAENNFLHFSSLMEVNVFSTKGTFIKRLLTSQRLIKFVPFKNKYAGFDIPRESGKKYVRIRLLDDNLKESTLLYKYLSFVQKNNKVPFIYQAEFIVPIGDRIYLNTPEGKILCFKANGKKIKVINPNIKAVPITKEYADNILLYYKTSRYKKMIYEMQKPRLYMSSHFPRIFSMRKDEGKLLVVTYERKGAFQKLFVMDKDGNLIGTKGIPLKSRYDIPPHAPYSYTIHKNKLYQLAENYDEETWEIHITPLVDWKDVK